MKKAVVLGAGGYIGGHLVSKLKELEYWVRGVDIKYHEFKKTDARQATHPHQIHLELLSEIGLLGYLAFFVLILYSIYYSMKNYLINKNIYQFASILFIISNLIPLIPSGSIFSTFNGGIFWFNFALMLSFNKYSKS